MAARTAHALGPPPRASRVTRAAPPVPGRADVDRKRHVPGPPARGGAPTAAPRL